MIGSKEAAEKISQCRRFMKYHSLTAVLYSSLSPLRFLMKNQKFKLTKGTPRLGVVQKMIWGVIRLIAVEILVPIVGRALGQGE